MSGIFLSYRRSAGSGSTDEIYDRLVGHFGPERVYRDVDDIPLGVEWVKHITNALTTAAYVLVAIGPRWTDVTGEDGDRRLDDPQDPVRFEVRTALELDRPVVPMLVDGGEMPGRGELPRDIRKLVAHNGIAIRPAPYFDGDVADLLDGLTVDGFDRQRVPRPFDVGVVARHLGYGGAIGWGLIGLVIGLLTFIGSEEDLGPLYVLASALAGVVAGWLGGIVVGWVTGMLVRDHSPPLVARRVRRLGLNWALGVAAALVVAGGIAFLLGWWIVATDDSEGFDGLGAVLAALVLGLFVFLLAAAIGAGVIAASMARRFRLRSDDLSRMRAFAIGVVWFLGSVGVFILMTILLTVADSAFGG